MVRYGTHGTVGTVHMVRLVQYTWYGWYGTLVQPVQSVQFIGTISLRTIHGRDVWHVLYHVPCAAIIYLYCTVPYHTYMYHDLILRAVPRTVPCTTIVPQYCTVLSPCAPYRTIYTKTPNGRYFHFRHLMKILVLIWAYHRTYFYFFSLILTYFFDTFKGSELIIRRICFLRIEEKTIDYKKKKVKRFGEVFKFF